MFRLDGCEIISVSAVPFPVQIGLLLNAGQLLQRFQICNVDEPVMDNNQLVILEFLQDFGERFPAGPNHACHVLLRNFPFDVQAFFRGNPKIFVQIKQQIRHSNPDVQKCQIFELSVRLDQSFTYSI